MCVCVCNVHALCACLCESSVWILPATWAHTHTHTGAHTRTHIRTHSRMPVLYNNVILMRWAGVLRCSRWRCINRNFDGVMWHTYSILFSAAAGTRGSVLGVWIHSWRAEGNSACVYFTLFEIVIHVNILIQDIWSDTIQKQWKWIPHELTERQFWYRNISFSGINEWVSCIDFVYWLWEAIRSTTRLCVTMDCRIP